MEAKTSEWRPGPTVCRCCLTEGCYKDISTEYFWMGKREVYSEMLSETFSVSISYSKSGGPNSQSRLICEQCISRLRDAADFKRQVVECEKMFMQHLDPGTSSVVEFSVPQVESSEKVKLERVKVEKVASDDDFDDGGFPDDDDDDDDLDDQPLMKLASKIPKKESLDLRDLLDNTKLVLKRKAPPTSKSKPVVPTKKLKSKKEVKPAPSKAKAVAKPAPKPVEKKKKEQNTIQLSPKHNAQTIVKYITAYPFKLINNSFQCVYCGDFIGESSKFREHMQQEHQKFSLRVAFAHIKKRFKVDCTDLRCRLCDGNFHKIDDAAEHLITKHEKLIDLNISLGVIPYKFYDNKYICAICDLKCTDFAQLNKHVSTHYDKKFTCDACAKSYASLEFLQNHMQNSCKTNTGKRWCLRCKKTFSSLEERWEHVKNSKECRRHVCDVCGERFNSWNKKDNHMNLVHGRPKTTFRCSECEAVFNRRVYLNEHFVISHTNDYLTCSCCGRKFHNDATLRKHMRSHSGEKQFTCKVCSKAFVSSSYLKKHMVVHSDIKYECMFCPKWFNRRDNLKTHMKSRHPEAETNL